MNSHLVTGGIGGSISNLVLFGLAPNPLANVPAPIQFLAVDFNLIQALSVDFATIQSDDVDFAIIQSDTIDFGD